MKTRKMHTPISPMIRKPRLKISFMMLKIVNRLLLLKLSICSARYQILRLPGMFNIRFSIKITRAFRALVHVICLSCRLGRIDSLEADIVRLIKSLDNVTRNEISDGLFAVLDAVCDVIACSLV